MMLRALIPPTTPCFFRGTILLSASAQDVRGVDASAFSGVNARGAWIGLPGYEQTAQFNARGNSFD